MHIEHPSHAWHRVGAQSVTVPFSHRVAHPKPQEPGTWCQLSSPHWFNFPVPHSAWQTPGGPCWLQFPAINRKHRASLESQEAGPDWVPWLPAPRGAVLRGEASQTEPVPEDAPHCRSVPAQPRPPARPPGPTMTLPQVPALSRLTTSMASSLFSPLPLLFAPQSFLPPSQKRLSKPRCDTVAPPSNVLP